MYIADSIPFFKLTSLSLSLSHPTLKILALFWMRPCRPYLAIRSRSSLIMSTQCCQSTCAATSVKDCHNRSHVLDILKILCGFPSNDLLYLPFLTYLSGLGWISVRKKINICGSFPLRWTS